MHDVKVKVDIVVGGEDRRGDFSRGEEMTEIGARVAAAEGASALGIHGPRILGVARVLDKYAAFAGIKACLTRSARPQHPNQHFLSHPPLTPQISPLAHPPQPTP